MTMNYQLERQNGEWHVKSRNMEMHGQPAGDAGAAFTARPDDAARGTYGRERRDSVASRTSRSPERHPEAMKVAILGGGPSGAFAAERLATAGVDTVVFDEKLAWEKPCGGGLTWKAYSQYPFLAENTTAKKTVSRTVLAAPKSKAVTLQLERPLLIYSRYDLNGLLLGARAECRGADREDARSGCGAEGRAMVAAHKERRDGSGLLHRRHRRAQPAARFRNRVEVRRHDERAGLLRGRRARATSTFSFCPASKATSGCFRGAGTFR